jgi:hypothetical protein
MSQKLTSSRRLIPTAGLKLSLLGALLLSIVSTANTGCEDKAIGRPCDTLTTDLPTDNPYNTQALECPMRICLKPIDHSADQNVTTSALCSAECSQDSDCDGQLRDNTNERDKRCKMGFACGVYTTKGALACKKLCICKDFLQDGPISTPSDCEK